ncbi:MAG TPA: 1-acyl-sn-glycerol-3-phosphate acyltransferase [Burkholderiales bacterium]|nr:1-acyl-sn-glycerol-3-phosphate acyltransferase [Burkholderiales bacterium]
MVSLPLWLAVLGGALAAWAAYDKLLMPALRWFLAGRANVVLEEVSARLRIGVRPFQRTRRQVLIHRLMGDPKVLTAAEQFAAQHKLPQAKVLETVEHYAREIVPAFNAYLYFRLGYWFGRKLAQGLYRVRLGFVDTEALKRVPDDATVVFVMNHRSNMDYILAGYLAADKAALSYAVGEWARTWPLSALIRSMGAYFVRRNSKDDLYRRVLERYIVMATQAGVPQAVFPEGGLTRDGLMREPRLGVVDYMLRGFWLDGQRDLVFVPLGLNYDRVLEDRTLLLSADPEARKPGRFWAAWNTLGFVANNLRLMLKSDWHRFGYACVNFGAPVSMKEYCALRGLDFQKLAGEPRKQAIGELGRHLMARVGGIVPVVPVPLIASVFIEQRQKAVSELELKAGVERLVEQLEAKGAHVYIPRQDLDYAVAVGLRMLTLRRLVEERDGLYAPRPTELPLILYYANSIAHLLKSA